jgi:hypothetical protein
MINDYKIQLIVDELCYCSLRKKNNSKPKKKIPHMFEPFMQKISFRFFIPKLLLSRTKKKHFHLFFFAMRRRKDKINFLERIFIELRLTSN